MSSELKSSEPSEASSKPPCNMSLTRTLYFAEQQEWACGSGVCGQQPQPADNPPRRDLCVGPVLKRRAWPQRHPNRPGLAHPGGFPPSVIVIQAAEDVRALARSMPDSSKEGACGSKEVSGSACRLEQVPGLVREQHCRDVIPQDLRLEQAHCALWKWACIAGAKRGPSVPHEDAVCECGRQPLPGHLRDRGALGMRSRPPWAARLWQL